MNAPVIKTISSILEQMSKVNQSTLTQMYGDRNQIECLGDDIDEESHSNFESKKKRKPKRDNAKLPPVITPCRVKRKTKKIKICCVTKDKDHHDKFPDQPQPGDLVMSTVGELDHP